MKPTSGIKTIHIHKDLKDLLRLFEEYKVNYLVVGAYAVMAHTEPRFTKDFDFWVQSNLENAKKVYAALEKFGAPLKGDKVKSEDFLKSQTVYQIGVPPNRIDVVLSVDALDFDKAWKNKKIISFEGLKIPVLSIQDLIKNKKAVGRPIDLIDVANLQEARSFFKNRPRERDKKLGKRK